MTHKLVTWVAFVCMLQASLGQQQSMPECAVNCTLEVTRRFSSCVEGIQCFCTNPQLVQLAQECFQQNCSIREALVARNTTDITCGTPDRERSPVSTAVTFSSMALALCLVAMRIIAITPDFSTLCRWDDAIVGVVTLLMIGNAICNPISVHYGYGKDVWRLPFSSTAMVLKIFYIGGILYAVGIAATKVAFLCFYVALFSSRSFRRVAFPLIAVCCIQGITFCLLFIFQCHPISYTWLQWDGTGEGQCLNFGLGAVLHAVTNILLDLIIFALPVTQLRGLALSWKKKAQVLSMFGVGFFVTLVSVLRLYSLIQLGDSKNPTWDYVPFGYWSDLEFNIGIACICMPSLRVVIRRHFPNCGLATTHNPPSGQNSEPAIRRVQYPDERSSKSLKSSICRAKTKTSSDHVELCRYPGFNGAK